MALAAKARFWGVQGSLAGGSNEYGTNTSCIEVDFGDGVSVFFDAGTGIRAATRGRRFRRLILCLSHFHWDHIQGIPYMGLEEATYDIDLYCGYPDLWDRLEVLFDPRFHPVSVDRYRNKIRSIHLAQNEFKAIEGLKGVRVSAAVLHHPGKSYAFRLESDATSFCFATDSDYSPVPEAAQKILQNADWCVMDSQFLLGDHLQKADYGHSSFKHTIDTAAQLSVRNCVLFHFDPNYGNEELRRLEQQSLDYARTAYGTQGPLVSMAREGREIDLHF